MQTNTPALITRPKLGLLSLLTALISALPGIAVAQAASSPVPAPQGSANTFETTLANGLKVIVREDRRAPSVVHMIWYGVGSMDELPGHTGISHMLEHAMFKGTEKLEPGEFSRRVAAMGGRENAFTSYDYTAYFQQIPPTKLNDVMALEADRMSNLRLNDDIFLPERDVVAEERRLRTEDSPHGLLHEQLMATAYQAHPYRNPIIGWMDDIQHYQVADVLSWYKKWYAPNNARLVIVGDVEHEAVFTLARQHYGQAASQTLPQRRELSEPALRGQRTARVYAPTALSTLALAWHVPALRDIQKDQDVFALDTLAAILDGFDGARLPRHLVRETRLAQSVSASYGGISRGPALFTLNAIPSPGHNLDELQQALLKQIERIAQEGVSEEELQRARVQVRANQIYKRDSLMGQAMEMGFLESSGLSWRDDEALLTALSNVKAQNVQAVAQRYFSPQTMIRTELLPQQQPADKTTANRSTPQSRQ